jgi:class 3 adenylate cyclase
MNGLFNVLAFRYQIAFILLLVLGVSFGGMLWLAERQLAREINALMAQELEQDAARLLQDMHAREAALRADAEALAAHATALGLFTLDETPMMIDALRHKGVLPLDGGAAHLFVMREDGVISRTSLAPEHVLVNKLPDRRALMHDEAAWRSDWIMANHILYQLVSVRVPGVAPAQGWVVAARILPDFAQFTQRQRGVILFDEHGRFLFNAPIHFDLPRYQDDFQQLFQGRSDTPSEGVSAANWRYRLHKNPGYGLPSFMLVYPRGTHFNFIANTAVPLSVLTILLILLSITLLRLFNRHTQDILNRLLMAVEQVERENYTFRLKLPKRDELAPLADSMNEMLQSLEQRERLHSVMEQIVSRAVAEQMLEQKRDGSGSNSEGTVLVADMRGFYALTETMNAAQVLDFLNDYLGRVSYCVDANHGEIDNYQGDTLVAIFGLHQHKSGHIMDALNSALDMLDAVDLFNLETATPLGVRIEIAIGLASGKLIAGSIGTARRASYSILGETVNRARYLQRWAKKQGCAILIDNATHEEFMRQETQALIISQRVSLAEGEACHQIWPRRSTTRNAAAGHGVSP